MDTEDITPTWSDLYTPEQWAVILETQAELLAKQRGEYSVAADLRHAAACIRDLSDKVDEAARKAENLMAGINEAHIKARAALETLSRLP